MGECGEQVYVKVGGKREGIKKKTTKLTDIDNSMVTAREEEGWRQV